MNGVDEFQYPFSGIQAIVDTEDISLTGTVNVTSFWPGPAGTTTTYVGDGVVVEVDFAAPGRLCAVHLPLDSLSISDGPLDDLISPAGRQSLIDTINNPVGPTLRKVDLGPSQRERAASSLRFGEGASAAGQVLAASNVGDDVNEHPIVRAIARFETYAASTPSGIGTGIISADRLDSSIGFALVALQADLEGEQILSRLSPTLYKQLVSIVAGSGRAVQSHPRHGAAIRDHVLALGEIISRNQDSDFQRDSGSATIEELHPVIAADHASKTEALRYDSSQIDTSDNSLKSPTDSMSAWFSSPGRLEVSYTKSPDGKWVKVFDHNLSLLATVPIIKHGKKAGGWLAQAVVPSTLSVTDIHVAVTSTDDTRSGDPFERISEAVDAGRDATQLAVAGQGANASRQWRICAALWNELGDKTRSNLAMAYANNDLSVGRKKQLHDSVRSLI